MIKVRPPKCPVCGTQLEWYNPVGLFRFRCPQGIHDFDREHSFFT